MFHQFKDVSIYLVAQDVKNKQRGGMQAHKTFKHSYSTGDSIRTGFHEIGLISRFYTLKEQCSPRVLTNVN